MNEFHSRRVPDLQKPIPGCMGRMINIFDLRAGMAGTKLLTDKAHRDGSPVRRSRLNALKVLDPVEVQVEDKPMAQQVTHELRKSSSSKKSGGTPMKMLIAQEMSKEMEAKQKLPGVVARLMGLDALPAQQPVPLANKTTPRNHTHNDCTLRGATQSYLQQEVDYIGKTAWHDIHPPQLQVNEQQKYKDVYEVWQQPSRTNRFKDQPLSKGSYNDNSNEKRMALVRQKFMEAKRLATDQRLLQSKEFQDALEVLSSNRDLFLRFLEEPNFLFSNHIKELRTASPPPQTKCITVLKPSKTLETKSVKDMKRHLQTLEEDGDDKNKLNWSPGFVHPKAGNLSPPTRIVVLKPSPGKPLDTKAVMTSPTLSPGLVEGKDPFEEVGTDETRGSRELAKEITRQMRESLSGGYRRDETLLSSVLSNGYVGDESSFNRSENEFMGDEGGNFSDSEIITPTSRHSWDYINRFGSPLSISSFSRASYSPESSVIREAKKRLSERWAMVASNGTNQEQRQVRRSSSTLGEMLAIPEIKKEEGNDGGLTVLSSRSCVGQQDFRVPEACSSISRNEKESAIADSPRTLLRSKSVPVSSLAYESIGLDVEVSNPQVGKSIGPKDMTKSKSGKSFKGKVSSFFFSRNKKPSREKSVLSPSIGSLDRVQSANLDYVGKRNGDSHQCDRDGDTGPSHNCDKPVCKDSLRTLEHDEAKECPFSGKAAISLEKPTASMNVSENQDQPSPISVLEAPFVDELNNSSSKSSGSANRECHQLISRSPPIESVARCLSWDDTGSETTLSSPLKLLKAFSKAVEDEEQYLFVQSLLTSAGLGDGKSGMVLTRWHSLESPLDPLLLNKFLERKEEAAKCRERRSNQRLLFDCVNAALLDISWNDILETYLWARACGLTRGRMQNISSITEEVWGRVRGWIHGEENWAASQNDNSGVVVDRVLRREVAGRGWEEMMGSEIDEIGKEIGAHVLKELIGEALADLIPGWLS